MRSLTGAKVELLVHARLSVNAYVTKIRRGGSRKEIRKIRIQKYKNTRLP